MLSFLNGGAFVAAVGLALQGFLGDLSPLLGAAGWTIAALQFLAAAFRDAAISDLKEKNNDHR